MTLVRLLVTLAKYLRKQLSGRETLLMASEGSVQSYLAPFTWDRDMWKRRFFVCVGEVRERGVEERRGEGERSITKI